MCAFVAKIWPDKVARWCRGGDFLCPVFTASRVQHVSDLHSKFALRSHHVWKHGLRRLRLDEEKKIERRRRKKKKDRNHRTKI